jgi:hypothetical protein
MNLEKAVRVLTFTVVEPLPGKVLPEMAETVGADEAVRRYKAVVLTTLRQLHGLSETRIRLVADPGDADEALRFWLLPRLADRWESENGTFRTLGWEIDFGGGDEDFLIHARGDIRCPYLGARWVHAAMIGLERGCHHVIATAEDGSECFHARGRTAENPDIKPLPKLSLIRNDDEWKEALESPLGAALRKAWNEETC